MPVPMRDQILAEYDVSRETAAKLDLLVAELGRWQRVKNLVGAATLGEVWTRHIADSLQLATLEPAAEHWLDLGSGAGFPGLVIAIALAERGGHVDLVESNSRKCAFLRHVVRLTAAPATIHETRLETVVEDFAGKVEVLTARALAPLAELVGWTQALLKTGTVGLFPKGREVQAELTEAAESWRLDIDLIPSRTDSHARIVRVRSLQERVRWMP